MYNFQSPESLKSLDRKYNLIYNFYQKTKRLKNLRKEFHRRVYVNFATVKYPPRKNLLSIIKEFIIK